ncbi:pilus assembly protein TadG-related protein [Silvibacterium sp.]|uniref:pilus assembly protein TadG-related protein n=1 Tax=Silvibacterium sp. TaxID=1964179 RepID=UPI0039E41B7D
MGSVNGQKLRLRDCAWRLLNDRRGQTTILVAFCMMMILGFIGLAIDVGHFRYAKRTMQTAADAAAIAAASEVRICGGTADCSAMQTAASSAMTENGFTSATIVQNCGTPSSTGITLSVNNPVCAVTGDVNAGKLNYVEAVVTDQVPTYFARLFGISTVTVSARAEAARGLGGPCIYALDQTGSNAISFAVNAIEQFNCGIVDESSSSSALSCLVCLFVYAPYIDVTGGVGGLLSFFSPPPHTNIPRPEPNDPLAYLPVPTNASATTACGTTTSSPYTGSPATVNIITGLLSNITFNPGVYCGGIAITAAVLTNITFNPGVYILRDGPGLLGSLTPQGGLTITINALSNIQGTGVMFYNAGNVSTPASTVGGFSVTASSLAGLGGFNLSAATSGEYGGVLFFQARNVTNTGTFVANLIQGNKMEGAFYLPDAMVSYGVSAISDNYNILVAKDIEFNVGLISTFGNNYATLQSGSPLNGDNVSLVQ